MADYRNITNQGNCIFCEMVKGHIEFPGTFWQDEKHIAFLTPWPSTKGFTVVIPIKHMLSDCLELPEQDLNELIQASKKVSKILKLYFKDVGRIGLVMEGTGINHAHTKLFPMHNTEHMRKGEWKQYTDTKEIYFEKYNGYITSQEGPKINDEKLRDLALELRKIQL